VVELVDLETRIGPLADDQREALREQLMHPGELFTVDTPRMAAGHCEDTARNAGGETAG
jgi:hypothetical protein